MSQIDLHVHSHFSIDGELSPNTLVQRSAQAGVTTIAITDHNCVRGIAEERIAGRMYGVQIISGAEFDCTLGKHGLHILGYGIDENSAELLEIEQNILRQERIASGLRIELVRKCGINLDGAWLCRNANAGVITGELIAEAALNDEGNIDNARLRPYRPGGSRSDNPYVNFYWDFCAQGKPAYVPIRYKPAADILRLIHRSGGVAVLAHPGAGTPCTEEEIDCLTMMGLDGIEAYSSYHTEAQSEFYLDCAQRRELLVTCGSDFHGKTKPAISLGGVACADAQEHLERLLQAIRCQRCA